MGTITEDYVSFETSKLLKEKGFDEGCGFIYIEFKGMFPVLWPTTNSDIKNDGGTSITVPTLQMAMKWLREVHSLYIWIGHSAGKSLSWYYEIHGISDGKVKHIGGIQYGSYELACGEAIKYCLENFIEL